MIHFENIEKKKQFIALLISLIMNIVVFLAEVILGYLINSLNIIADGVDSFGDSISYSVAIYSFFSLNNKSKDDAGMIIAIVQVFSAAFIFEEILRGILTENSVAEYFYGFIITIVSLVVNVVSAFLLYKASHKELNMKAAFIFSFMDIWMNLYTIVSCLIGWLVWDNEILDIIGGSLFFLIILFEAIKIFVERNKTKKVNVNVV